MNNNYTVYHLHTDQSLLDSRTNYKDYIDRAKELGQTALAFTEHGRLNWWVKKKMYCEKNGIKYIHGIEAYLTEDKDVRVRDNYHTVLLAKNYEGVKEINTLYSRSWNKKDGHFYAKPRITFDEFFGLSDNVIKISACLQSPLRHFKDNELAEKLLKHYDYYEIQPHNILAQHEFNNYLYTMAQKYNKPLILGTDTHSLNQYKAECDKIIKISKGWSYSDEGMSAEEETFDLTYHSYNELIDIMKANSQLPEKVWLEAIENTNVMAESCEPWELDLSFKYPILYGDKDEEKLWEKLRHDYLKKLDEGAIKKENADKYGEAVKEEMRVFKKINMMGFMLFMSELVDWCWEHDIPVGYSRGSVAGSVVAYLSSITDVDPIVWNTMFSRFANEDRVEIGDIDIDISPDQRELVCNYIINRFGVDNTAKILASTTLKEKGAIDEIGKGLHTLWKKEHVEELKRKELYDNDSPWSLKNIEEIKKLYASNPNAAREEYPDLFYYLDGCVGTVIAESSHPAGIVASPITLFDHYGVFIDKNDVITLPLDMDEVHEAGLVKYDILGLNNIQIIRDACKYAGIPYPKAYLMNWEDEEVWKHLLDSPIGIFQFESDSAFESLKKMKPRSVQDLALANAALRPSGESYREALFSGVRHKNPSKEIDDLLAENNGYLVFQEDVLRFLQLVCGLSGSEADNVRRAIGRKQTDRLQKALPDILEGYCSKSSKPRAEAEQEAMEFLRIIEDASSYMFGRNHSFGYSLIGYTCAWLRYYYPVEFCTSLLQNPSEQSTIKDIQNATKLTYELGFEIHEPKFRYSGAEYRPDKEHNAIYKGLSSIKSLNQLTGKIMWDLKDSQFNDFIDFLEAVNNTGVNKKHLDILTKINFFEEFGEIDYLRYITSAYQLYKSRKTIKKKEIEPNSIIAQALVGCYEKETPAQYQGINAVKLMKNFLNIGVVVAPASIYNRIKWECFYVGYTTTILPDEEDDVFAIQIIEEDKYNRIWVGLYQLNNGATIRLKCDKKWIKEYGKPQEGDVIKAVIKTKNKKKKVGNKFVDIDETEEIVTMFTLLNGELE